MREPHSPQFSEQVEEKLPAIYKVREKVSPGHGHGHECPRLPGVGRGAGSTGVVGRITLFWKGLPIYPAWILNAGGIAT